MSEALVRTTLALRDALDGVAFAPPVAAVYQPLHYAWAPHEAYLRRFGEGTGRVVFLGMNPGPFGMAQTGVPFGEVAAVRDWMGITGEVGHPPVEHPKRPVLGFDHPRSEVSGRRLWGWAAERWGTAEAFFADAFVVNYCPLVFLEASGRNRVPEKLPKDEREALFSACDAALREVLHTLAPRRVVGVGAFARKCAERVMGDAVPVGQVLHPSPASPRANRGWAEQADADLRDQGLFLDRLPQA